METISDSVVIGMLTPGYCTSDTMESLVTLCLENPEVSLIGIITIKTARSFKGRNSVIERFLDGPGEWLLWVDSDARFTPTTYQKLWRATKQEPYPRIVAALAFMYDSGTQALSPNIFDWDEEEQQHQVRLDYPFESEFWCDATGVHFALIHRSVFETVGFPWHQDHIEHPETGKPMGHDLSFYYKCRKDEIGVWYMTSAKTEHIKSFAANEDMYIRYWSKRRDEEDTKAQDAVRKAIENG